MKPRTASFSTASCGSVEEESRLMHHIARRLPCNSPNCSQAATNLKSDCARVPSIFNPLTSILGCGCTSLHCYSPNPSHAATNLERHWKQVLSILYPPASILGYGRASLRSLRSLRLNFGCGSAALRPLRRFRPSPSLCMYFEDEPLEAGKLYSTRHLIDPPTDAPLFEPPIAAGNLADQLFCLGWR